MNNNMAKIKRQRSIMDKLVVCNALNTSPYDIIDGMSCLEYWQHHRPFLNIQKCRACGKVGTEDNPIVGGHVISILGGERHVFITPIHEKCNLKRGKLFPFVVYASNLYPIPAEDEKRILADEDNVNEIKRQRKRYLDRSFDKLKFFLQHKKK